MASSSAAAVQQIERRQKVLEVLRHYVDRRSAGESVSDAEIIESHQELMPELGRELRGLGSSDDETLLEFSLTESSGNEVVARRGHTPRLDTLPGYEQLEEIKAGGQGVVYRAVQVSTGQKVAIKAIQGGPLASNDARARLLRETRILGSLRHANVVRIFDSGVVHGTVYYVMEYVGGPQLDQFLMTRELTVDQVVDLFARVCDGANAAHLLGVIHRDLKPSNILVDTEGTPRLLDFGLAKIAMADGDSDLTVANSFLGTAKYAAPEQCARRSDSVDVRADVYSLGVMLFEAIAGKMPYDTRGKREQLMERIQNEPPRDLKRVAPHVPNDLAAIVARCLRKDPEQRYQNAGELARELRRFRRGEPIDAKRDNLAYVLLKRAARYRWQAAVAGAVVAIGLGQAAFANYMWGVVEDERDSARAVTDLLVDTIHNLDPAQTGGGTKTPLHAELAASVTATADQLSTLANPEAAARVQAALGHLYLALGDEIAAQQQLDPAARKLAELFGPTHPETLAAQQDRGYARKLQDRYAEAESIYNDVLAARENTLGPDHLDVASIRNNLGQLYFQQRDYEQAERFLREALQLRESGDAPARDLASSMANLGSLLRDRSRALRRDYEATPDADLLQERVDVLSEADDLLRKATELRQALFTPPHLHVANSLNKLGLLLRERALLERDREQDTQAVLSEALQTLQDSLAMKQQILPANHWELAVGWVNVGMTRNNLAQYDLALRDLQDAYARFHAIGHRRGLQASLEEMVIARRALGSLDEVLADFDQAAEAEFVAADDAQAFREWVRSRRAEIEAELDS